MCPWESGGTGVSCSEGTGVGSCNTGGDGGKTGGDGNIGGNNGIFLTSPTSAWVGNIGATPRVVFA
jgi:hypothetical protein